MSGPKVINIEAIRLAQERRALQELRQIRSLASKIASNCQNTNDSKEFQSRAEAVLSVLEQIESKKNWAELMQRSPGFLSFLQTELNDLDHKNRSAFERSIKREQNVLGAVRTLKIESSSLGISLPEKLLNLRAGLTLEQLDQAEQDLAGIVSEVLTKKSQNREAAKAERLKQIASSFLNENDKVVSIGQWLGESDQRKDRFFETLASLNSWLPDEKIKIFQTRFSQALQEPNVERKNVLLDSINLELSEERATYKKVRDAKALLERALVLLAPFSGEPMPPLEQKVTVALRAPELTSAKSILEEVTLFVQEETKKADAIARRECILKALSGLGYDVKEGMKLIWNQKGKITLTKSGESQYGVEFLMPAAATAFQARVVAFRDERDETQSTRQRDKEVEESWCSDLSKVRKVLSVDGFDSQIVNAYAPGEQPVKAIGLGSESNTYESQKSDTNQQRIG